METESMWLSTKKFILVYLWEVCVQKQPSQSSLSIKRTNYEQRLSSERLKRGKNYWKYRPSDFFDSVITYKGKPVCSFDGSYCGYLNFDKIRYWDGRFLKAFRVKNASYRMFTMKRLLIQISARERIWSCFDRENWRRHRKLKNKLRKFKEEMSNYVKSSDLKNEVISML